MAHFRSKHPWDPGYVLPGSVLAEPPGRGTLTTVQAPRKTIQGNTYIPNAWQGGYALPKYIKKEPWGRGAVSRKWAPRKTIQQTIPESLAGITDIVTKPMEWGAKVVGKVGDVAGPSLKDLSCKVVSKEEAALLAGVAATYYSGGTAGGAAYTGTKAIGAACKTPGGQVGYMLPPQPQTPWVPIAIGGGLLLLLLATR